MRPIPFRLCSPKMPLPRLPDALRAHRGLRDVRQRAGECTGRELPNDIVVVGAHLDSWDLAPGAHDDGAGWCRPWRWCERFLLPVCAPNARCGGVVYVRRGRRDRRQAYAARAGLHGERHTLAVESDRGGFAPQGFSGDVDDAVLAAVRAWRRIWRLCMPSASCKATVAPM